MSIRRQVILGFAALVLSNATMASEQAVATMQLTSNQQVIGSVVAKDTPHGLLLTPHLSKLSPGAHGFHIHEGSSCAQKGMAAKGHLDPANTQTHQGPYASGHLGDLPVLVVDAKGEASLPVLAPRLSVKQVLGRSLMIHVGSDNYSDTPKLGGGGARVACGVFKQS